MAVLPALFLEFLKRWHAEKLPFQYHDQSMDPKAAHAIVQAEDPVKALCADRVLWQELAGDARLEATVRKALARVRKDVIRADTQTERTMVCRMARSRQTVFFSTVC